MYSPSPVKFITESVPPPDPRFAVTHRQELITGFSQASLTQASGVLIGAGGIGGEVGEGLCRKGVGHLRIFDHDVVEHTNLNRQHFFSGTSVRIKPAVWRATWRFIATREQSLRLSILFRGRGRIENGYDGGIRRLRRGQ